MSERWSESHKLMRRNDVLVVDLLISQRQKGTMSNNGLGGRRSTYSESTVLCVVLSEARVL